MSVAAAADDVDAIAELLSKGEDPRSRDLSKKEAAAAAAAAAAGGGGAGAGSAAAERTAADDASDDDDGNERRRRNQTTTTPLHWAADRGSLRAARALALAGAPLDARDGDGATPLQERDRILGDFAAGRIDVLSNVFVLTEGWDSPRAKVCLLARGTSSVGPYLQMIGRVLRPDGTGARALLIDLCGVVHQHGLPDEDRVWSLDGIKRTAEATQWIRQCAVCGSVFEGQEWPETCPSGHPFPARPPRKVKPEEVARVTSVVSRGEQQRYFDELSRAAERNGWKVTAVGMRFKMRFGFWPAGFRASRAGDVTERGAVG